MSSYAAALRAPNEGAADGAAAAPAADGAAAVRTVAVVDTNAIVRGMHIERLADDAVTVATMLAEVRDAQSRQRLAQLPFGLSTREPAGDAVTAVRRFATLTGDAAVLSGVDTQLLALALTLEWQAHGKGHLREQPPRAVPVRKSTRSQSKLPGWDFVPNIAEWEALERAEQAQRDAAAAAGGVAVAEVLEEHVDGGGAEQEGGDGAGDGVHVSRVLTQVQALTLDEAVAREVGQDQEDTTADGDDDDDDDDADEDEGGAEDGDPDGWEEAVSRSTKCRRAKRAQRAAERAAAQAEAEAAEAEEEEEEAEEGGSEEESGDEDTEDSTPKFESTVCLVTADFAMQNVALQMGLRVVAPDGLRITRLQRWVLRCHACSAVARDMGRHFCAKCGNAALQRVSLSVDAQGVEHVGVRKRFNLRGTRYSLPAPKGGRYAVNPVLREDQLAMRRLPSKGNKSGGGDVDVFAAEFGHDTVFERPGAGAAPSLLRAGTAPVVGRMRNPNLRRHVMTNRRK